MSNFRKPPRAILFDLDDTILPGFQRPDLAWREVVEQVLGEEDSAEIAQAIRATSRDFWSDPARHKTWRMRMRDARRKIVADACATLAQAGRPSPTPENAQRIADRFTAYLDEQISILPDAHHVLETLRAKGLKLALITNGATAPQREKIERFDLAHRFHHVQIEQEAGIGKPEDGAYFRAMDELGVTAPETWMVGDNLEWEVATPQRLGIFAVWADLQGKGLPDDSDVRPDLVIRTLSDLLAALGWSLPRGGGV
jgi:putative hydrolase of the HAD superfamily